MDADALFSEASFPPAGPERWRALVEKALAGVAFEDGMVARSDDGLAVGPLHERRVGAERLPRREPDRPFAIVQRVDDPDPERANRQARDDIENGANGLALVFEGAPNAFGYGLPATPEALDAVLDGIPLNRIHLRSDVHPASRAMADHLVALLTRRRANPERLSHSFGIDTAAVFAGTGRLRMSIEAVQASLPQSLAHFFALGVPGILLEADGRVYHNAGATAAQELGAMVAVAVAQLRLFEEARQPLIYSAPHIGFALSLDQNLFEQIAKLRALRLLWRRVQEACAIAPTPATIHAETSWRMIAARDPETNILRNTLAAFAGAAGGADTIAILPHTIAHGLPDAMARRIARNTQLVLRDESHIDFVADPVAGAGSVEALTDDLAAAAWAVFQEIEREGGILQSLSDGLFQSRVEASAIARAKTYRDGARAIVGTTQFRLPAEAPVTTLDAERRPVPTDGTVFCRPMPARRIDEMLEGAP